MAEECCLLDHARDPATSETKPDILIIGGGSAGFAAAIAAAESGARVVIAGEGTIGGTCESPMTRVKSEWRSAVHARPACSAWA